MPDIFDIPFICAIFYGLTKSHLKKFQYFRVDLKMTEICGSKLIMVCDIVAVQYLPFFKCL